MSDLLKQMKKALAEVEPLAEKARQDRYMLEFQSILHITEPEEREARLTDLIRRYNGIGVF